MKTFILIMFALSLSCFAQNDSNTYHFSLPELKIRQLEDNKIYTYEFDRERNNFSLNESTLKADTLLYKYSVPLKDIKSITILKRSNAGFFAAGAGSLGFLIGFIFAGFSFGGSGDVSFIHRCEAGLVGGGLLAIMAGSIAILFHTDYELDLSGNYYGSKQPQILKFLKVHNIR